MHALLPLLFFLAQPFWETKPPEQWTDLEVNQLLRSGPWTQAARPAPNMLVYFATARPIEEAELEARVRTRDPRREPDPDYTYFVNENRGRYFVLAVPYGSLSAFRRPGEEKRLEEETVMLVGKRKIHMVGHFPPTQDDPVLRIVFPREVQMSDKRVVFRLYLPGVEFPDKEVDFDVKDLVYHDRIEM